MAHNTRIVLIDALLELAGDEFESSEDFIQLAKKSEERLIQDLIDTARYYKNLNDE